tara:strand:- start:16635 stop:18125 length:1491 start_codon:yes stop_codon:yes gene_type:complete
MQGANNALHKGNGMTWIKATFISLILLGILIISAFFIWLAPVGAGYTAKIMCSAIFVNGLPSDRARDEDILADNSPLLSLITANVDLRHQTVSAHAFGFRKRIAVYRPNLGCTLSDDASRVEQLRSISPLVRPIPAQPLLTASVPGTINRRAFNNILSDAMDEPGPHVSRRSRAIVVLHQGKIIAERYAPGINATTPLPGWSMAKSVFNALIGRLQNEGVIPDVNTPVLINEWQAQVSDPRAVITYDDLLRMSSGLAFDESYWNPLSDVVQMLFIEPASAGFAVSQPLEHPPGTFFAYNSGTTNILSAAIRNLSGSMRRYRHVPFDLLFRPLGMRSAVIETDQDGYFIGSSFMHATARDWAKIGQFFLQDGVWNGERLLPEGWVDYSVTPAPAAPNGTYGAHWWLELPGSPDNDGIPHEDGPSVPGDAFFALGHDGQSISVIPSKDLVIVRLGLTRDRSAFDLRHFVGSIATLFPDTVADNSETTVEAQSTDQVAK